MMSQGLDAAFTAAGGAGAGANSVAAEAAGADENSAAARVAGANAAFAKIVRLCSVRDRSEYELRERLQRGGFAHTIAADAVERAVACGIVDDRRFADAYVRGKLNLGWGMQRIEREIVKYGVHPTILIGWPNIYSDSASEQARALTELERYVPRAHNARDARFRHLRNKGFDCDVAQCALNDFERGRPAQEI
jgi:regulatory protein